MRICCVVVLDREGLTYHDGRLVLWIPRHPLLGTPSVLFFGMRVPLIHETWHDLFVCMSCVCLVLYLGRLFESIGLNHQSALLELDPETGETRTTIPMDKEIFGEGLTYCQGKLIQLSYKAKKGFVYNATQLDQPPITFTYDTTTHEGWGFTYNEQRHELIVSDGSEYLHIWDPQTYTQLRKHRIMRLDGTPALRMNELEWWRDRVVANVWFEDVLLIINPESGLVEKEYDFSTLYDQAGVVKSQRSDVFNGISVSSDPDILYVTGKFWSNMFKIKLLPPVPEK